MRVGRLGIFVAAVLLGALYWTGSLSAEEQYPSRRIRVIVPFPPGSQTDMVARLVADGLSRKWGQVVVVDNIAGASGNLGTTTAFRSAPDGYTLLVIPPSFVINPFVIKNAGWTANEWAAISILVTSPYLLAARTGLDAATTADLVGQARLKPNAITYASGGVGSSAHLSAVQLEVLTGIKLSHVPYRGAAPALNDVMAGQVDFVFDALATTLPLWRDGKVRVLGIGSKTRSPVMPDVPTIAESGAPEFESTTWTAMVARPSTPLPIVEKISIGVRDVLHEPDVVARLQSLNLDLAATGPADSAAFLAKEAAQWEKIVKAAGISPE